MAAERVPALVTAVRSEGSFDVDEPTALRWLTAAHRLLVTRSKCYRKRLALAYGSSEFFSSGSGGVTAGSPIATSISSFDGLIPGLTLTDAASALAAGTVIEALNPEAQTLTMSQPAIGTSIKDKYAATVPDGFSYPLPEEVLEVLQVLVDGAPYGTGRHTDIAAGSQGWVLVDWPGVTAEDTSIAGVDALAFVPPIGGVSKVEVYASCRAPALSATDDSTLKVPSEFDGAIINGALAIGLEREAMRPDLAPYFQQKFDASCTELLKQTRRRFRGPGPTRIRVQGINAT